MVDLTILFIGDGAIFTDMNESVLLGGFEIVVGGNLLEPGLVIGG